MVKQSHQCCKRQECGLKSECECIVEKNLHPSIGSAMVFFFFFLNHIAALKMCCAAAIAHYLTFSVSTPIPDLSCLGFCTNLTGARKRGGMVVSYITW